MLKTSSETPSSLNIKNPSGSLNFPKQASFTVVGSVIFAEAVGKATSV